MVELHAAGDIEENLAAKIVEENDDFVVLNKPCGLSIHDSDQGPGLITRLREQRPSQNFFPVHRLDKPTSGLLLVAKSAEANRVLSMAFEQRQVEKCYWAVSNKKPRKKQGAVVGDMAKARGGSWKLLRTTINPARTQFFSFSLGGGLRAYLLKPHTGKTHQLRVALKSLGAAILGDDRYGGDASDRLYLHAAGLSFRFKEQNFALNLAPDSGRYFLEPAFRDLYLQQNSLQKQK